MLKLFLSIALGLNLLMYSAFVFSQGDNELLSKYGNKIDLVTIGLTTDRSATQSADGAFTADILARSGLVVALYNCQAQVAETIKRWAKRYGMRLIENKTDSEKLRLAYASEKPDGYFILEYIITSKLESAHLDFTFRSLTNVQLSGDEVGLEPLGQRLLEAIQCVP